MRLGSSLHSAARWRDHADGALRVLQGRRVARQPGAHRHAIFHQRAIHAQRIQPLAHFGALQIEGEDVVAASGKDDYRGAGIRRGGSAVQGHGWAAHRCPGGSPACRPPGHRWVWWCPFPGRVRPCRRAACRARAGWARSAAVEDGGDQDEEAG